MTPTNPSSPRRIPTAPTPVPTLTRATTAPPAVDALTASVLAGEHGPLPAESTVTSVFWLHHGTRLAGGDTTYLNQYVLVRLGDSFGGCAFEAGEIEPSVCRESSGAPLDVLLRDAPRPLRIAALDAYLARVRPHRAAATAGEAEAVVLPAGTPEVRAKARDAAVAGLLDIAEGAVVGLIGVVNPLVAAVRERGGRPLLCDFNLKTTQWGDPVTDDMHEVLDHADAVVATGMTLSNGSFDVILERCRSRGVPLVVYAQTGSAVARAFIGSGVTALSAEPFPYSQFSAEETVLYRYRAAAGHA
ncbi:Rossmann-like domain-containing protein [Streptomyces sp. URMC 126]|uniref:Rossmann-like domain-containing protein n=1 Tax=Streptomyces sp. URMC 126 TaxID=3423401 RepID=UPI003F1A7DF2